MKVFKKYLVLCLLLVQVPGSHIRAQDRQEGLAVFTDRGHYISGEAIQYRAYYRAPDIVSDAQWSTVLYVELVLPNGSSLAQSKVGIEADGAAGSLIIPEGLSSGTYYLKAYTRWMRNCGPEAYVYTSLQIYDPFNEQVLPVDSLGWDPREPESMLGQASLHDSGVLECRTDRRQYGTRDEVMADLNWKFPHDKANLTISVARTGLHGDQQYFHPGCPTDLQDASGFLPETKGLSISGQAVNAADAAPVPYATIYLTVLGEEKDFFSNYSDSTGRFYFFFPDYKGERDLFVSSYHSEYSDLELRIDRDFSQDALQLPSYPVLSQDSLSELITEMSVNAQVSQQYYPLQRSDPENSGSGELLFYGQPSSIIKFNDFIRLPTLEEYFIEVVPQVAVRRSAGVRRLVLLGEHPDMSIYPPLLMIDGVAIFDVEAVLAVSPRLIDRVEIVNAPYIRGNVTFGGIISLISKNNDLGYIDLPSSGLLVNYRMLDLPLEDTLQSGVLDPRLPDLRNTLYWRSSFELDPGKSRKFSFRTADVKGEYEILIRGFDASGKYLEERVPFSVE